MYIVHPQYYEMVTKIHFLRRCLQEFVWLIEYGLLNVSDDVAVFADDFSQCHFPDLVELRL